MPHWAAMCIRCVFYVDGQLVPCFDIFCLHFYSMWMVSPSTMRSHNTAILVGDVGFTFVVSVSCVYFCCPCYMCLMFTLSSRAIPSFLYPLAIFHWYNLPILQTESFSSAVKFVCATPISSLPSLISRKTNWSEFCVDVTHRPYLNSNPLHPLCYIVQNHLSPFIFLCLHVRNEDLGFSDFYCCSRNCRNRFKCLWSSSFPVIHKVGIVVLFVLLT